MPQRAREALDAFEACLNCEKIPDAMRKDVIEWRAYAERLVSDQFASSLPPELQQQARSFATASPASAPASTAAGYPTPSTATASGAPRRSAQQPAAATP